MSEFRNYHTFIFKDIAAVNKSPGIAVNKLR